MSDKLFSEQEQALLHEVMAFRRDVRGNHFIDRDVEESVIDKIISAAVLAPSVGYSQPWEFVIIRDSEIKRQVADNFAQENDKASLLFNEKQSLYSRLKLEGIREAPVNIAVFYKPSEEPVLGQTSMPQAGEYSVVCAVQNMWLMSRALNVGLGWVSILDQESIKKVLNAPSNNKLVAYLCLGYVDKFYNKPELEILKWKERKDLKTLIKVDQYR